jgi:hypothetical protein
MVYRYTLKVTDIGTSSLGTTFVKCQSIGSARLSDARLKEFYFTEKFSIPCIRYIYKIAKSVCLSVHPSAWNNLSSTGQVFMKLYI